MSNTNTSTTATPNIPTEEISSESLHSNHLNDLYDITTDMILNKSTLFYSYLLTLTQREFTKDPKKVPTMGVGKIGRNVKLLINEKFWDSINLGKDEQKIYCLSHEMLHVMYSHFISMAAYDDKDLHNVATDLYINSILNRDLSEDNMPGCGNTATWNNKWKPMVEDIKKEFEEGKLTKEQVKAKLEIIPTRGCHADDYDFLTPQECIDNGSDWIYSKLKEEEDKKTDSTKTTYQLVCKIGGVGHPSDHDWKDNFSVEEGTSNEGELEFIQAQIESTMSEVAETIENSDGIGSLPAHIKSLLDAILNPPPPIFNYSAYLRKWIKTFGNFTKVSRTRLKPNLIIEDGYRLKMSPDKCIFVALDTSGSMSHIDIAESLMEIYNVKKMCKFEVHVSEVDTVINDVWELKSLAQINKKITQDGISGRGGTMFEPALEYVRANPKYSGIIYFTDGYVHEPATTYGIPLLVVCTSNGTLVKWKNATSIQIPKGYFGKDKN